MLSRRSTFPTRPNPLSQARNDAARRGARVLDLTESNPTRAALGCDLPLDALADPRGAAYAPDPLGLLSARTAAVARLAEDGVIASPAHTLLTASTSEAYAFLLKLLCDPGDEVLVPVPSYPLLDHLLQLEDVRPLPYPLRYDGDWHVDVPALRDAIGPRTRAIIAVSPNNPTGSYLARAELAALAATGLPLICDEVFGSYPLAERPNPHRAKSALEADDALVFSLFGLSKLIGAPQLKVAWICGRGPAARLEPAWQRLEIIADSFLSVATPVQLALPALLAEGRQRTQAIRDRIRANWDWLLRAAGRPGSSVDILRSEGGWYAVLRVPAIHGAEAWALRLLAQDDVFVHPGYLYDFASEAFLVVSLLPPEAVFREGIERLLARVASEVASG